MTTRAARSSGAASAAGVSRAPYAAPARGRGTAFAWVQSRSSGSAEMTGKRLGILGGTFDPVHIAHMALAETAREQLALDRVLFVPAGQPWRKAGRDITPVGDRVAMVR